MDRERGDVDGGQCVDRDAPLALDFVRLQDEFQLFFLFLQTHDFAVNLLLDGLQLLHLLLQL